MHCKLHLLLHLPQLGPEQRVAPHELFDRAEDAHAVQRGLSGDGVEGREHINERRQARKDGGST